MRLLLPVALLASRSAWCASWSEMLARKVAALDSVRAGRLGLYVKDLRSGEALSVRGEESWYFASGVKVPIAIEVLRQVEAGRLSLETKVRLRPEDRMDGAGGTNFRKPGSRLSVRYLLDEMLIQSDNTASDLLISLVGLESVNRTLRTWIPEGFAEITRLSDVRRRAYSGIHPAAIRLRNPDFLYLKSLRSDRQRLSAFGRLIGHDASEFRSRDIDQAFEAYYAQGLNSGQLTAYGKLLEAVARGRVLGAWGTRYLIELMSRAQTGKKRIRAGFSPSVAFAHKTGTQHKRVCDFGVAWDRRTPGRKIVIAACARRFASLEDAERDLKALGRAIQESGILFAAGSPDVPISRARRSALSAALVSHAPSRPLGGLERPAEGGDF